MLLSLSARVAPTTVFRLLDLLAELRNEIYTFALYTPSNSIKLESGVHGQADEPALLQVSRQVRTEALPIFYAVKKTLTYDVGRTFARWHAWRNCHNKDHVDNINKVRLCVYKKPWRPYDPYMIRYLHHPPDRVATEWYIRRGEERPFHDTEVIVTSWETTLRVEVLTSGIVSLDCESNLVDFKEGITHLLRECEHRTWSGEVVLLVVDKVLDYFKSADMLGIIQPKQYSAGNGFRLSLYQETLPARLEV